MQTSSFQVHGHNQCSSPSTPSTLNAEAMMSDDMAGVVMAHGHSQQVGTGNMVAQEKQSFLSREMASRNQKSREITGQTITSSEKYDPTQGISYLFEIPNMATSSTLRW